MRVAWFRENGTLRRVGAGTHDEEATTAAPPIGRSDWSLADYLYGTDCDWTENQIYRNVFCGLPRRFHGAPRSEQRRVLAEEPKLTGTRWDAAIGAVAEHLAMLHDLPEPEWAGREQRFLERTWIPSDNRTIRTRMLCHCPPAIELHGVLADPRDFDARGGELFEWDAGPMTEPGTGPRPRTLSADKIIELLTELSEELGKKGATARIYVFGGAAIALGIGGQRETEDVDARVEAGYASLLSAVTAVGRRHGLGDQWLNDQGDTSVPKLQDRGRKVLYASANLTVLGASPRHLLAMKLLAARKRDEDDVRTLVGALRLKTPEEAKTIFRETFPARELSRDAEAILGEAFPQQPGHPPEPAPDRPPRAAPKPRARQGSEPSR